MKQAEIKIDITALMDGKEKNTLSAKISPVGFGGALSLEIGTADQTLPFTIDILDAIVRALKQRADQKGISYKDGGAVFVDDVQNHKSIRNRILEAMAKGEFTKELAEEALDDLEKRLKTLVDDPNAFDLRSTLGKRVKEMKVSDELRERLSGMMRGVEPGEVPDEIKERVRDALKGAFGDLPADVRVEVVDASEDPELAEALFSGATNPEEIAMKMAGIKTNVEFDGFNIHQHDDGKVCMGYNGEKVENTLAELQALAFRFQIPFKDSTGRDVPEEVLGKTVIDFLKDLNHDGHAVH